MRFGETERQCLNAEAHDALRTSRDIVLQIPTDSISYHEVETCQPAAVGWESTTEW